MENGRIFGWSLCTRPVLVIVLLLDPPGGGVSSTRCNKILSTLWKETQEKKSFDRKVRQAQHFHKFSSMSRTSKTLTSDLTSSGNPTFVENLGQCFPPLENDDNPPPLVNWCHRIVEYTSRCWKTWKYHSIPVLNKYIHSRPLHWLCTRHRRLEDERPFSAHFVFSPGYSRLWKMCPLRI